MAGPPGLKPLVAVVQVTSTPDKEGNFAACAGLVREAAGRGAAVVFLPEGFDYIGRDAAQTLSLAEGLDGDLMGRYSQLARYPLGGDRRIEGGPAPPPQIKPR
uniref:CN hydrolase domain-containing protein n=1 Tax=Calidris pygmaea TaxID=425635 RepID=A0A8C3JRL6_9CHAR